MMIGPPASFTQQSTVAHRQTLCTRTQRFRRLRAEGTKKEKGKEGKYCYLHLSIFSALFYVNSSAVIRRFLCIGSAVAYLLGSVLQAKGTEPDENWLLELISWNGKMPEVEVSRLAVGPSGRLWIATEGNGVFNWDGRQLEGITGFESRFISDMVFHQDQLYLSTDKGVFALSSWPYRSHRIDLQPDFPALLASSDSTLFILSASGQLQDIKGRTHSNFFPASESVLDFFHAPGTGLIAETEDFQWVHREGQWRKLDAQDSVESRRSRVLKQRDLLRSFGIKPDPNSMAFALEQIWSVSSSGLWHVYREEAIERRWPLATSFPDDRLELPADAGVILDRTADLDGYWWVGTESGLYRAGAQGVEQIALPARDPFVFCVRPFNDLWVGTGEALLSRAEGADWKRWEVPAVVDMQPDTEGIWCIDLSGALFRIRLDGAVQRLEMSAVLVGLVKLGSRVFAVSQQGELIDLNNTSSVRQLVPKSVGSVQKMDVLGRRMALVTNSAVLIFDIKDSLFPMGSLSRNIHYVQRTEVPEPLWLDDQRLALSSWTGWASWDIGGLPQPPSPIIQEVQLAQAEGLAGDMSSIAGGDVRYELPYDKSFIRLKLGVPLTADSRLWSFGYRLFRGDRLVSEEQVGAEVLIPSIGPGEYTLRLFTFDGRTGSESPALNMRFKVFPPLWQRWWFYLLLAFIVGSVVWIWARRRVRRIREENRIREEMGRLEATALRMQMNPHFIFNALESISNFILGNKKKEAIHYLASFAKLIRNTLESAHEPTILLGQEIGVLRNYLELEKMRYGGRLEFSIDCAEEWQEKYRIPPMLLQPYVENAVKHGLKARKGAGRIDVQFCLEENSLAVEIRDDGIGRKASAQLLERSFGAPDKKSMSMSIIEQRIRLLREKGGQDIRVEVRDLVDEKGDAEGTSVHLRLPLIEDEWAE